MQEDFVLVLVILPSILLVQICVKLIMDRRERERERRKNDDANRWRSERRTGKNVGAYGKILRNFDVEEGGAATESRWGWFVEQR